MPEQTGKVVIVTGANTGLGLETALAFYEKGAHVVLACRTQEKADQTVKKLMQSGGTGLLESAVLDLSDLKLVEKFADRFTASHTSLDVLINNAGVMIPPASKTEQGFELQFGVNFLGHFALTGHLYPLLKNTPGSRVVTISSGAYHQGSIDFDNLKSEKSYEPGREYSQSKLANLLFSTELDRRIRMAGDQVAAIAAQPGANKTDLSRHMTTQQYKDAVAYVGELMEPWQGALSGLYAAADTAARSGKFYGPDQDGGYRGYPAEWPLAANARDETAAARLWQLAELETGLYYPN